MVEFSSINRADISKVLLSVAIKVLAVGAIAILVSLFVPSFFSFEAAAITLFSFVPLFLVLRFYDKNPDDLCALPLTGLQDDFPTDVTQSDRLLEYLPVALLRLDQRGMVNFANLEARKILGQEVLKGQDFAELVEGLGRSMRERLREAITGKTDRTTEMGRCVREGQEVFLQVSLLQMSYVQSDCCIAVLSDKTELKALEAQFVQSQKMEAVGQLAGGIAHDFNNLLTAINGHSDLLLLRHKSGDEDYGDLVQIRQNSVRAAALVRQLLAFSRKQTLRPKVVNLVDVLKELTQLLNRLLGEKVSLVIRENSDIDPVRIDVQQFEQVIMNLVVNARDAMPDGGTVTICAKNIVFDHVIKRQRATIPRGKYVLVRVHDEGCGIDADILPKIFEPFFTTKRVGEGTGLGLSTVYGIIKQTGGFVFVKSNQDRGTQFEILLPIHSDSGAELAGVENIPVPKSNKQARGHILLVEDEAPVRSFAARALKLKGYTVDEAESGENALKQIARCEQPYDLYISDVIMPGLDGPSWVRQALENGPKTKVVFVSGYSEDAFSESKKQIEGAAFLAKPFSLNGLCEMVAEVLYEPVD